MASSRWPARTDGRAHIGDAVARGAAAVLFDADAPPVIPTVPVPVHGIAGLRARAGAVGSAYFGHPSRQMQVAAFTGTNGKTSCASWWAAGIAADGGRAATVGTLGVVRHDQGGDSPAADRAGTLTTPDAISLQQAIATLHGQGVDHLSLEASSIGLEQHRLCGTAIDVAVFTNLSRDHLDYHPDMAAYEAAKARLFAFESLQAMVVNGDDPAGARLLAAGRRELRRIAYGFSPGPADAGVQRLHIARCRVQPQGIELSLDGDLGQAQVTLPMVGRFNAVNAVAVCAAWLCLGVPFSQAVRRLEALPPVPGRMQRVSAEGRPLVVIDYAHTPDALASVLGALADLVRARQGRLWCVFGCGGDRDPGKRALMAAAAEAGADCLVLTSDNPRTESSTAILADMQKGLARAAFLVDTDRARSIAAAIEAADAADVVLIAGKGHETYQEVHGERRPFSDLAVASACLGLADGVRH
ncbi:MAG: UDP-N-acetylmuramoyl-L-alanyl-D-glutamate--2,6-diaminopimelate ligase [Burkholderiaceae bacterium]